MFAFRCLKLRQIMRPLTIHKRLKSKTVQKSYREIFFEEYLLFTNSVTSGLFMCLGDLAIQEVEYRSGLLSERYNWLRAFHMLVTGTLIGPLHHYYYVGLDRLIPKANIKTTFLKIAADQFFCAPLTILFFFTSLGLLEQKPVELIGEELQGKFLYVYLGDCLFWPPVQFINFYYLPTAYRVIYINAATLFFDVYLAYVKFYENPAAKEDDAIIVVVNDR